MALQRWLATAALIVLAMVYSAGAQSSGTLDGMWSDPPDTPEDSFCFGYCTNAGLEKLKALLDDPANDARPYADLRSEAQRHEQNTYVRRLLTDIAAKNFPLDPATDPTFRLCEPYGLARQMFSPHQLEIRQRGDRIELHYGEWDARRTVYLNRPKPSPQPPTRMGYSAGRYEAKTLVIETDGVMPSRMPGQFFEHSDQLRIVERYTRDGNRLLMTATLSDPVMLREPLVLKKVWRWSPRSIIAPYTGCERPTEFRERGK